jgi:Tfp pilus assembly protein PilX
MIINSSERGVSLYLAILILVIMLAIVLGLSTILMTQIKMVGQMGDSVIAFCAADTGIEEVLFQAADATTSANYSGSLDNGASWTASVVDPGGKEGGIECPASTDNFCIYSRGTYDKSQRAIRISR